MPTKPTHKSPRGFTLVEILLAAGIFTIIAGISTAILISTVQTEKKTDIRNAVYDDARVLMEQLANYIHNNAIDYDEYYSMNVLQPKYFGENNSDKYIYGFFHGAYASRFFYPGESLDHLPTSNPEDLGVECSFPVDAELKDCEVIYDLSQDEPTGQNPYHGSAQNPDENSDDQDGANAFCDIALGDSDCANFLALDTNIPSELYLLSPDGNEKIIIGHQLLNTDDDHAVAILKLQGLDVDSNGRTDLFRCHEGYACEADPSIIFSEYFSALLYPEIPDSAAVESNHISVARQIKLGEAYNPANSPFIPITPMRSTVTDLRFYINPPDDPYKAYAEPNMKFQPSVTIVVTMEPSEAEKANYPGGGYPTVTIQRTVSSNIYSDIETYPPTNDLDWLKGMFAEIQ